jgi:hypothetical protein
MRCEKDKPEYLAIVASKAVSCYRTMARYLHAYANGVKPIPEDA